MGTVFEGRLVAPAGSRFAVVVARFNELFTKQLLDGAQTAFRRHGIDKEDVDVAWVPGSFEVPLVARRLAQSGSYAAVVCLGAVIRGATSHFDYVAGETASGLQLAAIDTGVPVAFGVLTLERLDQAEARIEKGADAVRTALEMADLFANLRAAAAR